VIPHMALDRIVTLPVSLTTGSVHRQLLRELLDESGVFEGLSWPDAQMVADAVSVDVGRRDGVEVLRSRARKVLGGYEDWDDRAGVVGALNAAADVLEGIGATEGLA
jgi:hypothetical protein